MSNILPYQQKKLIQQLRVLRLATATIWGLAFLAFAGILLLIPMFVMVNSHYGVAESQMNELERAGVVIDPVDIADIESRAATLSQKLAAPLPPSPVSYIDTIRAVPSSGIILAGFSMESLKEPAIILSGTATTREALQRYVAALEKTAGVASVESPVSNYVKSTNSSFQITVHFTKS